MKTAAADVCRPSASAHEGATSQIRRARDRSWRLVLASEAALGPKAAESGGLVRAADGVKVLLAADLGTYRRRRASLTVKNGRRRRLRAHARSGFGLCRQGAHSTDRCPSGRQRSSSAFINLDWDAVLTPKYTPRRACQESRATRCCSRTPGLSTRINVPSSPK